MPSSYTSSARFTLQATGENNNTWGVILNQGVFQLVDDSVNGRIGLALSGAHALTVNLGATDEARMAFIDVTGGSGGTITAPSVPKGYFVHNGAAGVVNLSAGGPLLPLNPGDAGPVFTDGTTFYPVLIGGLTIKGYTDGQIAILKAYVDAQIAGSIINMPPVTGQAGKLLTNDGANAFWTATLASFTITTSLTVPTKAPHDNSQNAASTAYVDLAVPGAYAFRNRLINGDMRIDQRFAGAAVTIPATTTLSVIDRWKAFASAASKYQLGRNLGAVAPPVGFTNYLGAASLSAYVMGVSEFFVLQQAIEGLNAADLAWGTANAKAVTLSFQAYSSLTGNFGGAVVNGPSTRSYPFSFNIPLANTWTQISVTIPGDVTGSWPVDNTAWGFVRISLGCGVNVSGPAGVWAGTVYDQPTGSVSVVGTNAATLYLTSAQFEVGSVATAFERRPFAVELQLCQRYYQQVDVHQGFAGNGNLLIATKYQPTGASIVASVPMTGAMRATPNVATNQTTMRYVSSGGIASNLTPSFGAASPSGPIGLVATADTIGVGAGWVDTIGMITIDAEL